MCTHFLKFGAKTKAEEKQKMKEYKRSVAIYNMEVKNYGNIMKMAKRFSAGDLIKRAITGAKANLDMVEFALIRRWEEGELLDMNIHDETDPIGCCDMYLKNVRKQLILIEELFNVRRNEIREIKKKARRTRVMK